MLVRYNGQVRTVPDGMSPDEIAPLFEQDQGALPIAARMAQMLPSMQQDQTVNTMPALENAAFLTPEQTLGTLQIQQRSQENSAAQMMEQRIQRERQMEAEKDRNQQIKLQQQQFKNQQAEMKLRQQMQEDAMRKGAEIDVQKSKDTGEFARNQALTQGYTLENQARRKELGLMETPEEAAYNRTLERQSMEQELNRLKIQNELLGLERTEMQQGMLRPEQAARMNQLRIQQQEIQNQSGVLGNRAAELSYESMPSAQQAQRAWQQQYDAQEIQNNLAKQGIALNNQQASQQMMDFMMKMRDYARGKGENLSVKDRMAMIENATQTLMGSYAMPEGTTPEQYRAKAIEIVDSDLQRITGGGQSTPQPGKVINWTPEGGWQE